MASIRKQIITGAGVGNVFPFCRWYECSACCEAKETIGIWITGKNAHNKHAHGREGTLYFSVEVESIAGSIFSLLFDLCTYAFKTQNSYCDYTITTKYHLEWSHEKFILSL